MMMPQTLKAIPISLALAAAVSATPFSIQEQDAQLKAAEARMDSLAEYAGSTTRGKDDVPVSMAGSIFIRVKDANFTEANTHLDKDQARTWVDGSLDLALGVYPNSYVNLWTTLAMPMDLSGWFTNGKATSPNYWGNPYNVPERNLYKHSIDLYGPSLWESLTAGIDFRAGQVGAMFKAGGVLWVSLSPLTIWEREALPRFPSVFETFEDERTVSTYYKEKMFRPVKEGGRAFWTNRSFGGLELEAYRLPFDMTGRLLLSQPKDADLGTRDGLRLLAGQPGDAEMTGTLDFRGDVVAARLAKDKIGPGISVGGNFVGMWFDNELIYETEFMKTAIANSRMNNVPTILNSRVFSIDAKGNLDAKLNIAFDLALSMDDSVKFIENENRLVPYQYVAEDNKTVTSSPAFAAYLKVQDKHIAPLTAEFIYTQKDFYSPYAMTNASRSPNWRKDEMFLGAGSFRYTPNLKGINFKYEPEFNRGRIDLQYGVHNQVEEGLDILVFNYRLNGRHVWESLTSWSKFNSMLPIDSGNGTAKYISRVAAGDSKTKLDLQSGDLRGGTWEMWEVYGNYDNAEQASAGIAPSTLKWSTVLSADMAYDIGHWIGYEKNVMMHLNTALTGISKEYAPLPTEAISDMMLWSWFVQSEPTIAITSTFHMLGILGFETFRAEQAYTTEQIVKLGAFYQNDFVKAPIDILETAVGFGFDWDFAQRAGLHFRYRYATHTDQALPVNNWKAHFVTAETKVWF